LKWVQEAVLQGDTLADTPTELGTQLPRQGDLLQVRLSYLPEGHIAALAQSSAQLPANHIEPGWVENKFVLTCAHVAVCTEKQTGNAHIKNGSNILETIRHSRTSHLVENVSNEM
jgi:hypothetical protein